MNQIPKPRKLALAAVVGFLVMAIVLWKWYPRDRPEPIAFPNQSMPLALTPEEVTRQMEKEASEYDWEKSRQNLLAIGRLVKDHRKTEKLKPVSEWAKQEDTGLPLGKLADFVRGMPENVRFVESRKFPGKNKAPEIATQYTVCLDGISNVLTDDEMRSVLSKRGEDLPIIIDWAMYSAMLPENATVPFRVLVLRLNGKVEETRILLGKDFRDPLRKALYFKT